MPDPGTTAPAAAELAKPRRAWKPAVLLLLVACGGAAVASAFWLLQESRTAAPAPDLSLETAQNPDAMLLRVVATPWAHVVVDGVHRETTPFSEPIRLSPGRHLVRLEHPNAPPEERSVEGVKGQAILLDVRMSVQRPPTNPISEAPLIESSP